MLGKALDDVSIEDLQELINRGTSEGPQLEFKREHYGKNDNAKREFAADVSAMANARGGLLLIGIEATSGDASRIVGIEELDPDALVRQVADSFRTSCTPPILGVRVRWLPIETGRGVLMINVDRSWDAPHRVTVRGDNNFFIRDENGKHPMSVTELRHAFLFAPEVEQRVRKFRTDRLQILAANEGPLGVDMVHPRLILHIMPLAAITGGVHLDFTSDQVGIFPLGESSYSQMYSLDGLVTYSGPEGSIDSVSAFSTLFRNGAVEMVATIGISEENGLWSISLTGVERELIRALKRVLAALGRRSVPLPFYFMLSLAGIRGAYALLSHPRSRGTTYRHRRDSAILPELKIDDAQVKQGPEAFLRPVFDLMWNAFGHDGSPNYDPVDSEYNWH